MENTIAIDGITISYIEKSSSSDKIIFFIHGNSSSASTWQKQLQDLSFENYDLIAIDLPGHGNSSFSKNPDKDYSPIGTADLISKVIKTLSGNRQYLLVGFSYGSNVVAEMISMDIKPAGIAFIGGCVLGNGYRMDTVFKISTQPSILTYNEGDKNVVEKFINQQFANDREQEIRRTISEYLSVDQNFKPALFKGAAEGKMSDEIEALKAINIPVLAIYGENDQMINNNYLDNSPFPLWNKTIYKIPETGHWAYLEKPKEINEIIAKYAVEIFK